MIKKELWFLWFNSMVLICLSMVFIKPSYADDEWGLEINEDIEINIKQLGGSQSQAIIWFTCNQGEESAEYVASLELLKMNYQVYFPDILSAHFMSPTASNISKISQEEAARVVLDIVKKGSAKEYFLLGGARAAVPVLKALADDRVKNLKDLLKGALLLTPRVNKVTPEPGELPIFIDELGQSTLALNVLEGERTPNRWGLPYLKSQLEQAGSSVSTGLIKGVRGFFYLRAEQTESEVKMTQKLPLIIDENIQKF